MGLWGSKKVRSRSCSGLLDPSTAAFSLSTTAIIAANDYKSKFMDNLLTLAKSCTYTKLVRAQTWAKKKFPWGLLDTNARYTYTVDRAALFSFLQSQSSEIVELITVSTGSADPLTLATPTILQSYPDYDVSIHSFVSEDLTYTYNGANVIGSNIIVSFSADDEHIVNFTITADNNGNYLYVYYKDGDSYKYYFQNLAVNSNFVTERVKSFQSDYFFIVPFRLHEQRLKNLAKSDAEYKTLWKRSKQLVTKLGFDLELIDSRVHGWEKKPKKDDGTEQGDLGNIDEGYLYFGVPITGSNRAVDEYIFKYCLYLKDIGSNKVTCGDSSWYDGIHLQDYLSGVNVDWGDVTVDYIPHSGKPGKYYKEGFGNTFIIMKQLANGTAKRITVTNFSITDIICNEYCTTHGIPGDLSTTDTNDPFLIPLCKSVLQDMGISNRNQVCLHALRLMLDYHEKKSKSFSESKLGKLLIIHIYAPIIGAVLPVIGTVAYVQAVYQMVIQNKNPTGLAKMLLKTAEKLHKLNNLPLVTLFKLLGPKLGLIVLIIIIIIIAIFTFGAGAAAAAPTIASTGGVVQVGSTAVVTTVQVSASSGLASAAAVGTSTGLGVGMSWSSMVATVAMSQAQQAYSQALSEDLNKRVRKYTSQLNELKAQYEQAYNENMADHIYGGINKFASKALVVSNIKNSLLISPEYYEYLIDNDSLVQDQQETLNRLVDPESMERIIDKALEMVHV